MAKLTLNKAQATLVVSELTAAQVQTLEYIIQKKGAVFILDGLQQYFRTVSTIVQSQDVEEIKDFVSNRLTDEKRDAILTIIRQP